MPIPKDEKDMAAEGWFKELTIPLIRIKMGIVYCEEWDFFADSLPCKQREGGGGPPCGVKHVYLNCTGGKLFKCCHRHKTAMGPLTRNVGAKAREYQVSPMEAIDICSKTGQPIPDELKSLVATERSRSVKGRRPTHKIEVKEEKQTKEEV